VTGFSWSRGARKLLVTYRQGLTSHVCKWDLEAAAVEAHCKWSVMVVVVVFVAGGGGEGGGC
jgi:hypothetical protein